MKKPSSKGRKPRIGPPAIVNALGALLSRCALDYQTMGPTCVECVPPNQKKKNPITISLHFNGIIRGQSSYINCWGHSKHP